ncbi:ribonuclease III [bacterium]|nr:ribonuclease III [bacterium]MBU1652936.1 ribonuclease III [bacterium]MBU1880640.1 ribonuclease III [bacterium]
MTWFRWRHTDITPQLRRKLQELEKKIQYRFHRPGLLLMALKHRSYLDISGENRSQSNERLEFLGDAVLDLVVAEHFFKSISAQSEGVLTGIKSTIVSGTVLAGQALKIDLGDYLLLSENEERSGGRNRRSILEDSFEALIGAIYLDGGLQSVREFINRFLIDDSKGILAKKSLRNYKSALQELVQGHGVDPPIYHVIEESGPDHDKRFVIEVCLGNEIIGIGRGKSKKEAEQLAAAEGLETVEDSNSSEFD